MHVPQASPIVVVVVAFVTVLNVVGVAQIDFNQIQFMLRLGDE